MPQWLKAKRARDAAARKVLEISEGEIEGACTEYLELDGWRALKTDPVSNAGRGKGFGEKGMADRLYIRYDTPPGPVSGCRLCGGMPCFCSSIPEAERSLGLYCFHELLWIEWKRIRNGNATKAKQHQTDWHVLERKRGALTLIAGEDFPASISGFTAFYQRSGLRRRVL